VSRQIDEKRQADYAASLVEQLVAADMAEVPAIVQKLAGYRRWADPLLLQEYTKAAQGSNRKLHLALALVPVDDAKIAELRDDLAQVSPTAFALVRDALLTHRDRVIEPLWSVALDAKRGAQERFQAGCALATYAPEDPRWSQINAFVAGRLVTLEASALVAWQKALRPAKRQLIKPLAVIYGDTTQEKLSRIYATETLADYVADRPDELFDLLTDAELFQFPVLIDKLSVHKDKAVALAYEETCKQPPLAASEDQKELLANRQANVAVQAGTPGPGLAITPVQSRSEGSQRPDSLDQSSWGRSADDPPTSRHRTRPDDSPSACAHARRFCTVAILFSSATRADREASDGLRE
jgi:hypothetical protein